MSETCADTIRQPSGIRTQHWLWRPTMRPSGRVASVSAIAKIAAEGLDHRVAEGPLDARDVAAPAELVDRAVAEQRAVRSVAERERVVPEERGEGIDVVDAEGLFVSLEGRRHLRHHFRNVDLVRFRHRTAPSSLAGRKDVAIAPPVQPGAACQVGAAAACSDARKSTGIDGIVEQQSLRGFIAKVEKVAPDDVLRVVEPVSRDLDITSAVFELERAGRSPDRDL